MFSLRNLTKMAQYNVVWEIVLDAKNPLEAAKLAEELIYASRENWQWYVHDNEHNKVYSVDLSEGDEDAVLDISN